MKLHIILGLLLFIVCAPGIAADHQFHKLETTSGDTYYPMRLSMYLKCRSEVPRSVRSFARLVGESEQESTWDRLPDFFMEWDEDRQGYVLLSNEEPPEKREILGYVDIEKAYRRSDCRHYMKVEALGGITRNILVSRVAWPIVVRGN